MISSLTRKSFLAAAVLAFAAACSQPAAAQDDERPGLDVIYVPTPHQVVKRMLELAKVGPDDIHYDLGSGDGRIVIAAVKDFKAKKGVGIDLDPQRIKEANANLAKAGVGDRVTFLRQNIFETDFSEANVVSLYLLSTLNFKLRPTILNMRPGTRIVTQSFDMADWAPEHTEVVDFDENGYKGTRRVYLYIVPAKIEGKWSFEGSAGKLDLDLKQHFQRFAGTATIGGKTAAIKDGKLNGAAIAFTLDLDGKPVKFEGKVDGNTITGANWIAKKAS